MVPLLLRAMPCIVLALPPGPALCSDAAAARAHLPEEASVNLAISAAEQDYDQVTAMLPGEQAALAPVALAQINIALHGARLRAQQDLCPEQWTPNGALLLAYGPRLEEAASDGRSWSWVYRAFRQAGDVACSQVTRARFFLEMSRYLPDWITIRPAGQQTAYRQGEAVLPPQAARVASR